MHPTRQTLPTTAESEDAYAKLGPVYNQIINLTNPATRENALLELSKKREAYDDLAPTLWHSFGLFMLIRRNCSVTSRNYCSISDAHSADANRACLKPGLQRISLTAVCSIASRNSYIISISSYSLVSISILEHHKQK